MGVKLNTNTQNSIDADVNMMIRRGVRRRKPNTMMNVTTRANKRRYITFDDTSVMASEKNIQQKGRLEIKVRMANVAEGTFIDLAMTSLELER
jgi:hypothetical protein